MEIQTALLGIIIFLVLIIFILQRRLDKLSQNLQDLKDSSKDLVEPGLTLIQSATKRAQQIISQAEVEALKIPTEQGIDKALFEKELAQRFEKSLIILSEALENSFNQFQNQINKSLISNQQKHDIFLGNLEKQSLDWKNLIEKEVKSKVESSLLSFEQQMTDFFAKAETQSAEAINLELKSARDLIDSYKAAQLKIVDENIVAVLERTLNLILKQKLTLKDQLDLVYEALEKAKVEKFLV